PHGDLESVLAERIAADAWRLRRVPIFEAALYRRVSAESLVRQAAQSVRQYEKTNEDRMSALIGKKDVAPDDRKAHEDANQRLARALAQLNDPYFDVTRVLETSPEPFKNLWRHEVALS